MSQSYSRLLLGLYVALLACQSFGAPRVPVQFTGDNKQCAVRVYREGDELAVSWSAGRGVALATRLSLVDASPLVRSISARTESQETLILENAMPTFELFVGQRRQNSKGPHTFFDRVDERKYSQVPLHFSIERAKVRSLQNRASIELSTLRGEGFSGSLRFSFFAGSRMIHVEAIVSTDQTDRAILFRGGLSASDQHVQSVVYHQAGGQRETIESSLLVPYRPWKLLTIGRRQGFGEPDFDPATTPLIGLAEDGLLQARYRAVAMETPGGAVAVFPSPHKFHYPLDFADNVGFNFAWSRSGQVEIGVRQPPLGDGRFRPWVDCPPGSQQHLDLFLLLSPGSGEQLLEEVAELTNDERYPRLPGFKTFSSHYHMWHTRHLIQAQQQLGTDEIPAEFRQPMFIDKMKDTGIDIVHLAEFHGGPKTGNTRIEELQRLHSECARLSDEEILVLPGEEPNVHLGGHWVSFFPRPVYWDFVNGTTRTEVRQRIKDGNPPPFRRDDAELGPVYFVNSAADVQKLFELEQGLYWTAHPRIKGSTGYPDRYRSEDYFRSPSFFGAAWKAMPANYAHDRLGKRVLDLLDDMNRWGSEKQILGEADLFQLNPASELYGHANINYLILDRIPKFEEGWSEVLDALRQRKYFTSTGEVLVPSFAINGEEFPVRLRGISTKGVHLKAEVRGTFPLAYAEIIYSDGPTIFRQRIDMRQLGQYATTTIDQRLRARDCKWVRLEVWDIAQNGAFTQPVLFGEE